MQLINNINQLLIHPEFYFILPQQQNQIFNDSQFKRFVFEFLSILEHSDCHVDDILGTYPIMDIVFVYLFRSFLIFNEKAAGIEEYVDRK